ncbi:DUF2306 domain-containing protein [Arenimonas terrae]|jgi:uncharacterized membrane protein|uniref:DUF2306 domain-containing protein n=1 Tax=Arenimonas terrae TaxID=2546226 RepID=A0A5C4RYF0_9GAMM|nr:DUF2306 domain-containing protein [Arenimonas terrae]TNJ35691.1 DUF2306 domain-containing protein [Arenimonas terrae]
MSAYEDRPVASLPRLELPARRVDRAGTTLSAAAAAWFTVAALGQWLFVVYIAGFYGRSLLAGRMRDWNQVLPEGHTPGDTLGNLMVMLHILLALVVTAAGTLQLVPAIRRRWPRFHRWNGRIYLATVVAVVLAGLYMVLARDGGLRVMQFGILLNAAVVLGCAAMALRHALARRIDRHRRWALRLFVAASGVWFFRIGLTFWLLVNQGPVGFDPETFTGPFLVFLSFAQTLLPLAILELYLRARDSGGPAARWTVAALLALATGVTATGIFAASLILWLPRL